jgi:heptosyltransferase-2
LCNPCLASATWFGICRIFTLSPRTTTTGQVDILTKPRSQADRLLCADSCVDRVLWVERDSGSHAGVMGIFRLAALLRQGAYQRVWILHGSTRYVLAAWLAGIPERIGIWRGWATVVVKRPGAPAG